MQQNISTPDRYIRMVTGLLSLGMASRRRASPMTRTLLWSFGAMKLAEGAIGWCPMQAVTELMGNQSQQQQKHSSSRASASDSSSKSNSSSQPDNDYDIPSYSKMENPTQ
ncbi:DUF2892 domain-containing protein [Alicyclobacillus fastidiosus]|uniref:DUF2892 domain-containing protein n=1 Tax=Alicyclobacillus fastidiosus TaxID=392011 RepID=A0ABY6ZC66_9BACL|nr:DUF2892 domain-containing protein [Alicyclobacillus fastidiosus]WAH40456.1 DUF2892 domain-containing protein [Alicyclobacillus fastidiosus]GMA61859.1 hypothetical protein GCM10025859_22990 [Alicyclobacillus fastidiosus]